MSGSGVLVTLLVVVMSGSRNRKQERLKEILNAVLA